jgi:hypothetical protein
MDMKDKIIIIVLIYFVYVAVYQERKLLGCKHKTAVDLFNLVSPCDEENNSYSSYIRNERPQNPFDVFERVVLWRKSFLLSIIIILMYNSIVGASFDGIKILSGVIIGTFFIYFSFNFYKYHLDYYIYNEIMKNYNITPKV